MADASESFNVEAVKSQMSTLEGYFNDLSEKLSEINKTVNEEINVGPESAVFGQLGSKLLGTWNANASTFGDFHANFESWSQIVAIIAANNTAFDAETINLYKSIISLSWWTKPICIGSVVTYWLISWKEDR